MEADDLVDPMRPGRVSRRRVTAGLAWSAPAILMAADAPAAAASKVCSPVTLTWRNFATVSSPFTTGTVGGVTVSLTQTNKVNTITSSSTLPVNGAIYRSVSDGITSTSIGGFARPLAFSMQPTTDGAGTQPMLTFSQPVTKLSFTLIDIDTDSGNGDTFRDQVTILTPGFTVNSIGSAVTRSGNVFTGTALVDNVDGSTNGNVRLTWSGPVSSVGFDYRQTLTSTSFAFIAISAITFTPTIC